MKDIIFDKIKEILKKDFVLEKPKDKNLAHYATPLAFSLAKEFRKSPKLIADELALEFNNSDIFTASPLNGYLNFRLKPEFLDKLATDALNSGKNFAEGKDKKEKILLEYVSANPTGPLHIGHVRGAVYGDTLARVGRYLGYDITTEYYINDAGNQINMLGLSIFITGANKFLNANLDFEENCYKGDYIENLSDEALKEFGKDIFKDRQNVEKLSLWGKDKMLLLIKDNLLKANIKIQNWVSEKSFENELFDTLNCLKKNGGVYEKDGKIWINSSALGDEKDRVIIREDKRPTYLAGDIVYHYNKFKRGYDHYINIWGADHHGYIKRVKSSIHYLGFDENKLEVILAQMVSLLKDGETFKMSKRAGNFILMSDVLEEIGSDALRFIFITKKCDTALEFDVSELSKEDSSNPIFYINYAHARIHQIFAKSGKKIDEIKEASILKLNDEALNLLFEALTLNEVLEDAFLSRNLQKIPDYLKNIASNFHKFYNENRVLGSDNEDALLKVFAVVALCIKTGLSLMGIEAKNIMTKE